MEENSSIFHWGRLVNSTSLRVEYIVMYKLLSFHLFYTIHILCICCIGKMFYFQIPHSIEIDKGKKKST